MAMLNVRLLPEEKARLVLAAEGAGEQNLSDWARRVLLSAAAGVDNVAEAVGIEPHGGTSAGSPRV